MNRYILLFLVLAFGSCKSRDGAQVNLETDTSAIILSVDEAFRPAIEEQVKVFLALHPGKKLVVEYKPEAACWNDLYRKEVGMVIASKSLTVPESAMFYDSIGLYPQSHLLAYDAIAIILSRESQDSVFSVAQIKEILTGNITGTYQPVFDGLKATGTVRFALDSILSGRAIDLSHIRAASNSKGVIEYISAHPDAMGFIGVGWIGNPEDPEQIEYRKKVRMVWLPCRACKDSSYSYPVQEEIFYRRYPFTRAIFAVVKEKGPGRFSEFVNFMKGDQGQLLFRRMYLVPARRPFIVRETIINPDAP
jgi:phosphate transport system substrate-binding protein